MTNKILSYILKCNSSCAGRGEFSASLHHTVFSVTWSFRNHNVLNWWSGNISYYYQCWNQLCCLIFFG